MNILEEPITLSILGGLISLIILYIKNKITKKENNKIEYLKQFFLVFVVVFLIIQIFIYNKNGNNFNLSGGNMNYFGDNFEIRSGQPDF